VLVHISPSCPVLQYSLEVLFGNAVVLLMCSASLEWAPFIKCFRSGIWQIGWLLHHCDMHLDKNCCIDIMLNEKECCGEEAAYEVTVP